MNIPKIRPCAQCNRLTRPSDGKASDYPVETRARRHNLCDTCHRKGVPVDRPAPRQPIEHIQAGLDAYLTRRRERISA